MTGKRIIVAVVVCAVGAMLAAQDNGNGGSGDPDTLRIKILDKGAGDGVVYDNRMGASDGSHDGTVIRGGNIRVHGS